MAGPYDLSGTMVDYFLSEPEYSQPYYVPYVLFGLWYYEGLDVDFNQYFEPFGLIPYHHYLMEVTQEMR